MDFRQLELFLAVMDTGSVTRAAERVFLSPGAVSMQLHQLAADLRTELFVRSGRKFLPTPSADRLAVHARRVMQQMREIELEFEADPSRDTRPFHFATGATALIHNLGKPLRAVRAKYPHAEIRVTVSATEQIVAGLLERRFDLGLITLPFPEENLTVTPAFEEELLVIEPSKHAVRSSVIGTIRPERLQNAPFLLYPHSSNMRSIINRFFLECGITPNVVMEADDTEAIKGLVESGFGYSILPRFALRHLGRHFRCYRVAGHRVSRIQALAMPKAEYPRALTTAICAVLASGLAAAPKSQSA
jgi:DNA-binding transcriptional LysR family regulator